MDDLETPLWPQAWVRALMPTAILACLEAEDLHGYAIGQALGALGFGIPRGGSLYPALARLDEAGFVSTQWRTGPSGPARRIYSLTDAGGRELAAARAALHNVSASLGASPAPGPRVAAGQGGGEPR
jgi:PadR family transcriptional regulator PadR